MTMTYLQIEEEPNSQTSQSWALPDTVLQLTSRAVQLLEEGTLGLGIIRNGTYKDFLKKATEIEYQPGT